MLCLWQFITKPREMNVLLWTAVCLPKSLVLRSICLTPASDTASFEYRVSAKVRWGHWGGWGQYFLGRDETLEVKLSFCKHSKEGHMGIFEKVVIHSQEGCDPQSPPSLTFVWNFRLQSLFCMTLPSILLWQHEWTNTSHKAGNIYSLFFHGKSLTPLPVKK